MHMVSCTSDLQDTENYSGEGWEVLWKPGALARSVARLLSGLTAGLLSRQLRPRGLDSSPLRAALLSAPPASAHPMPSSPTVMTTPNPPHGRMFPGGTEGGKTSLKESQIKDITMAKKSVFYRKKLKRKRTGFKGALNPYFPVDYGINVS